MAKGFSFEEALKPVEPQGFSFEEALQPPAPEVQQIISPYEQMAAPSDGEYSGTNLKDIGKLASASAVKSIFGAPEAVQAAGSGVAKDVAFKPTEALNFLADPRQLTNQLAGYVGMKPIFEQEQNAVLGKDLVNKQRVALDEALSKGKIQSLREVTKYGSEISKMIEDTVSPEMKEALANTEPTGNVLKALDQKVFGVAAGDTEISFGKAPSAQGLIGQAARVFGSAAPGILTSFITKSATPAAVFGFGQAGGEAVETAREHISRMSDTQLAKESEYYRNLLVLGYPPKEARAMTEEKAADTAAYYQGIVGALGGAFTGNLVAGKFDATKLLNAKNVLTRISKGTAVGMVEEGAQELAEGIATDLGINRTVVREMGVDSFANAVLGAIGGGGPGAVSGALSKPKEPPPPPPPPGAVPPDATGQIPPTVPPVAPPAVPLAKMAEITADEIEEDTPIKKGVTGVTPPAAAATFNLPVFDKDNQPTGETDEVNLDPKTLYFEDGEVYALGTKFDHPINNLFDDLPDSPIKQALIEASNKLIADNTKPKEEEPPEKGPLKPLTPAEAAIKRLKPEFQKEYFTLKEEADQIIAKQKELISQGEAEDSSLNIRLEEINKRFDAFYNDKQYRKALIEKLPNDPVIEKEALALADELEKVGDTVSSDGLRRNLANMGGYTDPKKLDYYKGKLLEAQQKAGVAEEMPKETYSLDNYVRSGNKTEVKRFNEFLPKASAEVQDLVAKSNGYLQAIADVINSKGYKVTDILGSAPPGEMREFRDLLSGIAGSAFSYVKNAEHIAKNNRFASPEKLAKIVKTLENDFVNADKLLGKKVEEEKPKQQTQEMAEKYYKDLTAEGWSGVETYGAGFPIMSKEKFLKNHSEDELNKLKNLKVVSVHEIQKGAQETLLEKLGYKDKLGSPTEFLWTTNLTISPETHNTPEYQKNYKAAFNKEYTDEYQEKNKADYEEELSKFPSLKKPQEPTKAKTQAEINRERQAKYKEDRAKKIAADREDFLRRKAEQEENQKKPEVKAKTIEKIKKNMVRFASGMSGLSDLVNGSFTRAKHKNYGVGFDVGLLSKNAIKELAHFVVNMDTKVFIDSGAFSHFRKQLKGQDVGELDFDKILAKYDAISEAIAEENAAEKTDYPRPLIVMPDVVGDQKASLELVKKYAKWIETEITFNQFEAIIPIQKGELTLSQAFSQIMDDLGTNKFIVGIPSNESAVSRQELIEFLRESRPHYVHFLGSAADSKIDPLIDLVATYSPGTDVTADASKVRSAILNGVAKGKTRAEAIKDALYEEEDPMVVMNSIGIAEEEKPKEVKKTQAEINRERQAEKRAAKETPSEFKVGDYVFYKEPVVQYKGNESFTAEKTIRAEIKSIKPNGDLELKSSSGYAVKPPSDVSKTKPTQEEEKPVEKKAAEININDFVKDMPALQQGKAKKDLQADINYKGEITSRADLIKRLVDEGRTITEIEYKKPITKTQEQEKNQLSKKYIVGASNENLPGVKRLKELQDIAKNGNVSIERVLGTKELHLAQDQITKTGMDYAKYLISNKSGVVVDDEGEKIDSPLFVDMADKGYKVLGFDNPRTYADKAGNTFRTIEKDGVRLAIDARKVLFKQQGKEYGRVQYGIGKEKDVTFEHLEVDPSKRKQGLAKQAIQDLIDVADKNGYTLYLEPAQLEDQGMTKEQLSALYSKYGFVATNESGTPMEREPGAKAAPVEIKKTQAEINRERQAEKKNKVEEKKPSTDIVPKVDESWAEYRKEPITSKPSDMSQEVFDKYQDLQKGNFSFEKVSFTGAQALARANAANKERKKVYEKAVHEFLNYPITAKAPTKNQPKIEVGSIIGTFPPPIAKNIKVAKTLDEQKKALLTLAALKDERRVYLQGVLVEPNQLVVTDGHRLAVYKTNTGVAEKTLLDKDNKVIDMQYAPYDRVLDKTKDATSYGMVNATALGNYVRGVSKAWKYVSASKQVPFSFQLKNGDKPIHFNGTYIEDMANVFRQFGYEGFEIQYNDGGMLVAKSPDNKLTQIVMGTRDDSLLFQPFNVQEKRPGVFKTAEEQAKFRKELGLSEESRTIDVEATEITEEQIMLLSDETGKLSKKEMDTLEQYYGFDRDSKDFFAMLREDVIRYVNKGANAVDETIRSIIAKLQAGVLAVAIVFNPTYMSESSAVLFPSKPGIEQVRAAVPESAKDMSEGAKKAYATLYPALQEGLESKDKLFTIVDKPTSKMYVFNPDGSLLVKDNVLLGKALGDTYVGQTEFKENRVTPAGLIKVKAEKGSATYDGKTIYTFGNVKEGWRAAFIHTVYLKESDAEARKKALETGKDTRMSYGCINAKPELMAKIAENNRMDESHVFVVPDNQEMVDEYIANTVPNEDLTRETVTPVTKTTQVPTKGSKSIGTVDLLGREEEAIISRTQAEINKERQAAKLAAQKVVDDGPFFNNFDSDFAKADLDESIVSDRKEKIKEQAVLSRKITNLTKKVANEGSTLDIQSKLNRLLEDKNLIKEDLADSKPERRSADWFRARATEGKAKGELSAEAMAVVDVLYAKYPTILETLKLSIRQPTERGVSGNFRPLNRMVTIYHSTLASILTGKAGERQAATMRHEITHSLEQMMTSEQQIALVEAWGDALSKAIKANPGPAEQNFFKAVLDFVERPNEENFKKATNIMPDMDFYQYMNPSEFWAVNAEKLMKAQLGTPWARFVKAVQKIWEAIKSVFGFNNRYAVHREFDRIMSGDQQVMTKKMLVDYVKQMNENIDFLRNIEKIAEENENVPEVPDNDPKSFKEMMIGTYGRVVENAANIAKNPRDNSLKALDKASEGILYTRIKNFWFGAGLEARDFAKYNGAIRTADNMAVASLAVKNVIHAGSISTQVLLQGALEYSTDFMQFIAVKRDYSMKNVARLQYDLRKKLGRKEGDKTIQAYLVASRSRGIYNTYVEAQAKLEMAIDTFDDAARAGDEEGRTKAYNEMQEADRALEQAIIAYQKIPTYLRQLNEKGETIYETVEDRKGNEYKLPVLNDEQIDLYISRENKYPELAKILEDFTAVNHEMIDNMVKSSRISLREGERLKKMKGYVPWNRVMDEQEDLFDNRKIPSMPSNIKYFKKGETEREIGNIIENMNHNVTMMTRSAIRNYAQVRIVQEYARRKENGKLQLYPSEGRFESGVRVPVFIAGQRRIVEIPDAMVAEAILGMITPPYQIPMQKLLGAAAQLVRRTVTFSAYFQLKQVFYDAPTAAWVSGVYNPLAVWTGAFSGFVKAVNPFSNDPIVEIMRSAGIGGFQSYHRTPKKEQDIEFGMVKRSAFAYALKIIDHIGDSSDYAQRIATYNQVFKETGDKALALMQAADVIDFQKHGNGRLAQALRVSVTFMQAYATQLDVLTQAMVGGNLKGQSRVEAATKFHLTGVAMASLMVLWAMMSCGDDDYHELDDDVKARNLYVPHSKKIFGKHILIPLRSTAAMFYKVMPELIYYDLSQKGTKNEMDKTRFWKASGNAAVDMLLGPTPIPSAFKGAIEISLDRNFYTGGNITPDYLKKLEAARQYTASTSELGKIFSAATQIPFTAKDGKENKRVLSPIQADHLMRSLGGSVATVSMYFTNMVFNSDRPSTQLKENPLLGGLVGADVARRNESLFYDLKERSDKVYGTFQDLVKNDRKRGIEYRKDNIKMIQAYGYTSAMAQNLSTMNQQIRRLSRSEDLTVEEKAMTPEQKRERINFFNQKKQEILKDVIERRKMAGL
jgi:GNAT superfamily N-acetyltransferase